MNPLNPNVPTAVERLKRKIEQRKGLIESMAVTIERTTRDRQTLIDEVGDLEAQLRAAETMGNA